MNIFLIPSWYPSQKSPISGIFTKEQTMMIAKEQNINYYLSILETFPLSPKRFMYSFVNFIKYTFLQKEYIIVNNHYIENIQPVLSWSYKYKEGNIKKQIELHTKFFQKLLKKGIKIDIIHAHVAYPAGYIAYKISQRFDIPYIITEHMSPFPFLEYKKNKMIFEHLRISMVNAKYIIAVSDYQKNEILRYGRYNMAVIPNFIDEDRYNVTLNSIKKKDKVRFLLVGGMSRQKGIDLLIRAISLIKHNLNNCEFILVGDGDKKLEYQTLTIEEGLNNIIFFKGFMHREEMIKEFNACDIFVLPSRHESFGIVYIEAMALGKPIIATKCGGPEMIVCDECGVMVETENIEALSRAIMHMYLEYKNYSSDKIRQKYIENFSKKVNTKKYKDIYEKVLECVG